MHRAVDVYRSAVVQGPDQDMNLKIGDFVWQEPGATRAVRNTSATRIEFVEFELK